MKTGQRAEEVWGWGCKLKIMVNIFKIKLGKEAVFRFAFVICAVIIGKFFDIDLPMFFFIGGLWSAGGNLGTARYGLGGCGDVTAGLSFRGYDSNNSAVTEKYNPINIYLLIKKK